MDRITSLQDDANHSFNPVFTSLSEEMILYEFSADGSQRKTIIVPMHQ